MYVYIRSEPGLWTVGYYDPQGKWQPESDHGSTEEAAGRVAELNGDGPSKDWEKAYRRERQKACDLARAVMMANEAIELLWAHGQARPFDDAQEDFVGQVRRQVEKAARYASTGVPPAEQPAK